jgi:hypothetical protein
MTRPDGLTLYDRIFYPIRSQALSDQGNICALLNMEQQMPSVACVLKTPAVSKTHFPELAPVRIDIQQVCDTEIRMLLHLSYHLPSNCDANEWVDIILYAYAGRIYELVEIKDILLPLARGEAMGSGINYTIDRDVALSGDFGNGLKAAVAGAENRLREAFLISKAFAIRPLNEMPYLLVSQKLHSVLGRPYHEFMLSVETSASNVSVEGVQCARWPIWECEKALADVTGRMIELEGVMMKSAPSVQGEVAMFNLVGHSALMFTSTDLGDLQAAYRNLPGLPGALQSKELG